MDRYMSSRGDGLSTAGRSALLGALLAYAVLGSGAVGQTAPAAQASSDDGAMEQCLASARQRGARPATCIGAIEDSCVARLSDRSESALIDCASREHGFWDRLLNPSYKQVLAGGSAAEDEALRAVQRQWLAWRDARCDARAVPRAGAVSARLAGIRCVAEETALRAIDLDRMAGGERFRAASASPTDTALKASDPGRVAEEPSSGRDTTPQAAAEAPLEPEAPSRLEANNPPRSDSASLQPLPAWFLAAMNPQGTPAPAELPSAPAAAPSPEPLPLEEESPAAPAPIPAAPTENATTPPAAEEPASEALLPEEPEESEPTAEPPPEKAAEVETAAVSQPEPEPPPPPPTPRIEVTVAGVKTGSGSVVVALCDKELGRNCPHHKVVPASLGSVQAVFQGIAPGQYAVGAFHDVNANEDFDRGAFGIPKEPYALSNNALDKRMRPSIEDAKLDFPKGEGKVTLTLRSWGG